MSTSAPSRPATTTAPTTADAPRIPRRPARGRLASLLATLRARRADDELSRQIPAFPATRSAAVVVLPRREVSARRHG